MLSNKAFTGVGNGVLAGVLAAGMSRTLHVAPSAGLAAAGATTHPAFWAYDAVGAAAVINPQPKRRTTAATGQSVDRGTT